MRKRFIYLTLCALLSAGLVHAQGVTTGSISGVVLDPNNEPLPGVTVVATLPATGNRYGSVTDVEGRFRIVNAKVGGPYQVAASLPGFQTYTVDDAYVRLGEATYLSIALQLEAATGEIEVVGESSPLIGPLKMGVASSVSEGSIQALPSIERGLYDYARTNPVMSTYDPDEETATTLSISGRNPRYNNISIDGSVNNDVFGLADSGTPGGQSGAQPIQLDVVQELQLVTSSFDVRQGGFTGGSVNAITKSGTNELHGDLYGYYSDDGMVGSGPEDFAELGTFEDSEFGGSLGGTLSRDKVFFFTNYTTSQYDQPTGWSLDGSTGQPWQDGCCVEEAEQFRQFNIANYDYDPGGLGQLTRGRPADRFFLRFDFNLNQSNTLVARYNYLDAANVINRPDNDDYEWHSEAYDFKTKVNSLVGQWNAVFSDSMFNELRVTYQTIRGPRTGVTQDFPHISIGDADGNGNGWEAGTEQFSTYNNLDQDIIELTNDFSFFTGNHEIVIGTHNEFYTIDNLFIQDGFGSYSFDDLDAYYAGTAYRWDHTYANDPDNPSDRFKAYQLSLYAGDTWRAKSNLSFVFGLRMDVPIFPDSPEYNPLADQTFGVDTSEFPSGNILWSPRIGFNWDITGNATSQLRGGAGLFSGRTPFVWLSNNFARTGTRQTTLRADDVLFNPDPYNQPDNIGGAFTQEINAIDPDFNFPQTWRANLAYDHRLPWWRLVGTAEVMWAKSTNEINYQNLNFVQTGELQPFDGRPIYERLSSDFTNAFYLDNTDIGDALNLIFKLELPYGEQPFWGSMSYAWGEANVVNDGTSSRAVSNWQYTEAFDVNNAGESTSDFEIRHRGVINLNYEFNRSTRWPTTVSLFWNRQSGKPWTNIVYHAWWANDSINGDDFSYNDLIYVPTGADDVVITNGTWGQLEDYLEKLGLLKYAGTYAPRNANGQPWVTQTDLSIRQNIPIPGRSHFQLSLDIMNFWNLIDDESGHVRYMAFGTVRPYVWTGNTDDGKPIIELRREVTDPENYPLFQTQELNSRWKLRLGLRWTF